MASTNMMDGAVYTANARQATVEEREQNECFCKESHDDTHVAIVTSCKHVFGRDCLLIWCESIATETKTCPMCRAVLYEEGMLCTELERWRAIGAVSTQVSTLRSAQQDLSQQVLVHESIQRELNNPDISEQGMQKIRELIRSMDDEHTDDEHAEIDDTDLPTLVMERGKALEAVRQRFDRWQFYFSFMEQTIHDQYLTRRRANQICNEFRRMN
ncbi:unnamed protein product [Periconia digitata]|uniref:RING-type domain-containing protein n=1 Tax=Periconia digitata TaxID=1303443 RepID=A0A9W4UJR2_9PLEO|nr:unnamed protein product [Periconia digitata]